jgi:hypothetical protein
VSNLHPIFAGICQMFGAPPARDILIVDQDPCPHCGSTTRQEVPANTVECDVGYGPATFTDRGGGEYCVDCDHPFNE